jgi:hypothetical protein
MDNWWLWLIAIVGVLVFVASRWPNQMDAIGKNMQQVGWTLTLLVTLPIVGLIFFGIVGLIVGGLVGLLLAVGMVAQATKKDQPPQS